MQNTVQDFWRMVWEHGLDTIVMLTKCVEGGKVWINILYSFCSSSLPPFTHLFQYILSIYVSVHPFIHLSIYSFIICSSSFLFIQAKCEQYWPERLNETLETSSHMSVKLVEIMRFADFEKKIFHIVNVTFLILVIVFVMFLLLVFVILYHFFSPFLLSFSLFVCSSSHSPPLFLLISSTLLLFFLIFLFFHLIFLVLFILPLIFLLFHFLKTTEEHTSPIEVTHWQFLAWPGLIMEFHIMLLPSFHSFVIFTRITVNMDPLF